MSDLDGDAQEFVSVGEATDRQGVRTVEDAKAEAVLLALGEPLAWRRVMNTSWADEWWGKPSHGPYSLYKTEKKGYPSLPETIHYQAYRMVPPSDYSNFKFNTLAEAKAACERHYATGKWEAEHFVEVPE